VKFWIKKNYTAVYHGTFNVRLPAIPWKPEYGSKVKESVLVKNRICLKLFNLCKFWLCFLKISSIFQLNNAFQKHLWLFLSAPELQHLHYRRKLHANTFFALGELLLVQDFLLAMVAHILSSIFLSGFKLCTYVPSPFATFANFFLSCFVKNN
jgi:hypothetical protein